MLDGILQGLATAVMPTNLMMVMIGCFVGTFIGMLPGLGPISAIALMIPITYGLEPASGLILMAGVYYGAIFGGSTSSILINAPGCSATVVTSFDGYLWRKKAKRVKLWHSPLTHRSLVVHCLPLCCCLPRLPSQSITQFPVFRLFRTDASRSFSGGGLCRKRPSY